MRRVLDKTLHAAILLWFIIYALCIVYPLFWLVMNGFKSNSQFFLDTWSLPERWNWSNYRDAWEAGVGGYFFNSLFVTCVSVVLILAISSIASFALSRFEFKGKNLLFIVIISGLMLAPQVSLIALYKILQTLRLYDTYWGLIVPYVAFHIPFAVFLMRSYFLSLPREVEDSAYIDGCNSWKVFWHVVLPMSRPIIASTALLTGMSIWNEFMFAMVFVENSDLRTIPVGVMNLRSQLNTDFGIQLAALAISAVPVVIAFILLQKHFVRGLSAGSVKG